MTTFGQTENIDTSFESTESADHGTRLIHNKDNAQYGAPFRVICIERTAILGNHDLAF